MSLDITGLDKVLAKLGRLETLRIMEEPMERSLLKIEAAMSDYPPPPAQGEWAAKTSSAQKRAFFALLRAGLIKGKRSGNLGRKWTHAITKTNDGMEGRVGNNVPYAPWINSKKFQVRFAQGRWNTDQGVLDSLRNEIVEDFRDTARRALQE